MRWRRMILAGLLVAVVGPARDIIDPSVGTTPYIRRVEPETAKVGEIVTAFGEALGAKRVDELYLTTGSVDIKMEILAQTEGSIRFKIPVKTPEGRFCLMVSVAGEAKLIEQPVHLVVR